MTKVLVCVLFCLLTARAADARPDIEYRFHITTEPRLALSIELRFNGGPAGFSVLGHCLSRWIEPADCARFITPPRAHAAGAQRPVRAAEPTLWIIDHQPGEAVVVRYDVEPPASGTAESDYAPVVTPASLRFFGEISLLVPEHLVGKTSVRVAVRWPDALPSSWTTASSFGVGARSATLEMSIGEFVRSLFWAGPLQSSGTTPGKGRQVSEMVWMPSTMTVAMRERCQREVWRVVDAVASAAGADDGVAPRWFLVPSVRGPLSAITLSGSIVVFAQYDEALLRTRADLLAFMTTLAHETVHHRPEGRIALADESWDRKLLSEGAAEFLARRALVRAGLIWPEDWLTLVSTKLERYAEIVDRHGVAAAVSPQPSGNGYVAGDLVLLVIDAAIRQQSAGRRDVTTWLRALADSGKADRGGVSVSGDRLQQTLRELVSPERLTTVLQMMRGERRIELSADMLADCASIELRQRWSFSLGFDLHGSINARIVSGVEPSGAAWQAGMRNGQKLHLWSVRLDRPDLLARFEVEIEGSRRAIRFFPRGLLLSEGAPDLRLTPGGTRCRATL